MCVNIIKSVMIMICNESGDMATIMNMCSYRIKVSQRLLDYLIKMKPAALLVAVAFGVLLGIPSGSTAPCECSSKKPLPARTCGEDDVTYYRRVFVVEDSSESGLNKFYTNVFSQYSGEDNSAYVNRIDVIFGSVYVNLDCRWNVKRESFLKRYYEYKFDKKSDEDDEAYFERVLTKRDESEDVYKSKCDLLRKFVKKIDWSKVKIESKAKKGFSIISKIKGRSCVDKKEKKAKKDKKDKKAKREEKKQSKKSKGSCGCKSKCGCKNEKIRQKQEEDERNKRELEERQRQQAENERRVREEERRRNEEENRKKEQERQENLRRVEEQKRQQAENERRAREEERRRNEEENRRREQENLRRVEEQKRQQAENERRVREEERRRNEEENRKKEQERQENLRKVEEQKRQQAENERKLREREEEHQRNVKKIEEQKRQNAENQAKIKQREEEHQRNVKKIEEREKSHNENVQKIEARKKEREENVRKWIQANYRRKSDEDDSSYFKRICTKTVSTDEEYVERITQVRSVFTDLDLWYKEQYLSETRQYYTLVYSKKSSESVEQYYQRLVTRDSFETDLNSARRLYILHIVFPTLPLWYEDQYYSYVKFFYQTYYKKEQSESDEVYLQRVFTRCTGESEENFWKRVKLVQKTFSDYQCWYNKEYLQKLDVCKGVSQAKSEEELKKKVESEKKSEESEEARRAKLACLQVFFKSSKKSSKKVQTTEESQEEEVSYGSSSRCQ